MKLIKEDEKYQIYESALGNYAVYNKIEEKWECNTNRKDIALNLDKYIEVNNL